MSFEFMVLRSGGQKYFFDLPDGSTIELSTYHIPDSACLKVDLELSKRDECDYEIIGVWGPMTGHKVPGVIKKKAALTLLPGDYKFLANSKSVAKIT